MSVVEAEGRAVPVAVEQDPVDQVVARVQVRDEAEPRRPVHVVHRPDDVGDAVCRLKRFSTYCHMATYCAGEPALPLPSPGQLGSLPFVTSFSGSCHSVKNTLLGPSDAMLWAISLWSCSAPYRAVEAHVVLGFQFMSSIVFARLPK